MLTETSAVPYLKKCHSYYSISLSWEQLTDSLHLKQTTPEMHIDIIIIIVETISQITDCGIISNGTLLCIPGVQKL